MRREGRVERPELRSDRAGGRASRSFSKLASLMMARTARPGSFRADVIGCPSTWATGSVCPSLRSLMRSPPRPHPSPFPLALAQARPSHLCPLIQAGSPGQRLPKVRCLSDPPARRRAGALSGARHRVPDRAWLPTGRQLPFPLSHKQVVHRCPQRWDLSQTCWHKYPGVDY